jgi:hypothetical protein
MDHDTEPPTAETVKAPVYGPPSGDCVNVSAVGDTVRVPGDVVTDGEGEGDGGAGVLGGGVGGAGEVAGAEVCAAGMATALGEAVIVTVTVGLARRWRWRWWLIR